MSRIGKKPVPIEGGAKVSLSGRTGPPEACPVRLLQGIKKERYAVSAEDGLWSIQDAYCKDGRDVLWILPR